MTTGTRESTSSFFSFPQVHLQHHQLGGAAAGALEAVASIRRGVHGVASRRELLARGTHHGIVVGKDQDTLGHVRTLPPRYQGICSSEPPSMAGKLLYPTQWMAAPVLNSPP
jgi:hypothetical protein